VLSLSELLCCLNSVGLLSSSVDVKEVCDELRLSVEEYSRLDNKGNDLSALRELLNCNGVAEAKKKRGRPRKEKTALVEPKKRGRPRKEKKVSSTPNSDDLIASLVESVKREETKEDNKTNIKEEEEEEEAVHVKRREINGKMYLLSSDNIVYDIDSHDEIGTFNEETEQINN
jgi:hypothetical protein